MKSLNSSYNRAFTVCCVLLILLAGANRSYALDYYWVNGSGNWSDYANHWAKIPNPAGPVDFHANVPTATDDVYFGFNGGTAYTVFVNASATVPKCRNMDWTATPAGAEWGGTGSRLDIYGSLELKSGMLFTFTGEVHFIALGPTSTIRSNGVSFPGWLVFEGNAGGWQLDDALTVTTHIEHLGGLLETMGQTVTLVNGDFNAPYNTPGMLDLGTSTLKLTNGWAYLFYPPAQFSGAGSKIEAYYGGGVFGHWAYSSAITIGSFESFQTTLEGHMWYVNSAGTATFHGPGNIRSDFTGGAPAPLHHNVIFEKGARIDNANQYEGLTLSAGYTYIIGQTSPNYPNTDQTLVAGGTLTAVGAGTCSEFITIKSWQFGSAINFINNSGTDQTIHCVIMEDIHASGANTLSVNDGIDLGNNTGWIFVNPHGAMNLYWVEGAGNWDDACHWTEDPLSLTGDCNCIPNGATNVHFTANSGFTADPNDVEQVVLPVDVYCRDMDWRTVTGKPVFSGGAGAQNYIYGSMYLAPPADLVYQNNSTVVRFRGGLSQVNHILMAGQTMPHTNYYFEGEGEYEFDDSWHAPAAAIRHSNGKLRFMGHDHYVYSVFGNRNFNQQLGSPNAELWVGDPQSGISSTVYIDASVHPCCPPHFLVDYSAGKFHAMESNIIFENGPGNVYRQYASVNHDFWNVTFINIPVEKFAQFNYNNILNKLSFSGPGKAYVQGSNNHIHEAEVLVESFILGEQSFDILTLGGGLGYQVQAGKTQTISSTGTINVVNASCEGMAFLYSGQPNQTAKIRKEGAGSTLTLDRVILDNVLPDLSSGATYAATNSFGIQAQVTTNWNISNPASRSLHWVGGAGAWNDANHWSLASGGAGGACPPTPLDDVYFDGNSGLGAADAVTVQQYWAFCRDMDWTGSGGGVLDNGIPPTDLYKRDQNFLVFGSLKFAPVMANDFDGVFRFRSTQPATLTSGGIPFKGYVEFWDVNGDWSLLDDFNSTLGVYHYYGKLTSNNHDITVGHTWDTNYADASAELDLGASTLHILSMHPYQSNGTGVFYYGAGKFHGGTSHIIFENTSEGRLYANPSHPIEFYDVTFKAPNSFIKFGQVNHKLTFEKTGDISGGFPLHEVEFQDDGSFSIYQSNKTRDIHLLRFAPGKRYTVGAGFQINIVPDGGTEGQFIAQGLPGQYIEIKSTDFNTPAIVHMDDIDNGTTCTKYLFLTGMNHTGTEDIYVPTPGGNVYNNSGWQFFPCNPCPATIPELDPSSITVGCAPGTARLLLANLKPDEWANWYDDPEATNLIHSGDNLFEPPITGPATYYARVYSDGGLCVSTVILTVNITTTTPPQGLFSLTGGGSGCTGANIEVGLDGSETGVLYQLLLDGINTGSPLAGTGSALSFGYQTVAGTYTVVANPVGASCPADMNGTAPIIYDPLLAPAVLVSSNGPVCEGGTDLELYESGGEAISWSWTGPNGFAAPDQNPVIVNPATANSGTYTVMVSSGNGCTNSQSVDIAIHEVPQVSCPADLSVCISDLPLDLSALGAAPGDGNFTGTGVSGNNFNAGLGTTTLLTYTVTDLANCSNACTFFVTVNEMLQVSCPANQVLCPSELPLDLSALGATPGGGTFSGTGVLGNNYNAPAGSINTVTYMVTDANNCAGSCTFDVQVKDGPVCSITNDMDMACPLTTNNQYQAPAGMDSYAWSVSGSGTPTTPLNGSAIEVTAGASGSYTVSLTVYKNGCSATCSKLIHIDMSDMEILGADYCSTDAGPMIGLSGSDMGVTYQLQTGNGVNLGPAVIGTGNPIYFGMYPNGNYQVVVMANSCTQTVTGTVNAQQGVCAVSAPDFCSCDAANGRAPVLVKINAPEGQNWTVKAVIGLYDAGSPPNTLIPLTVGTPLVYLGGNMFGLDALRRTDKGYWVQLTNGITEKDLMVGNAAW
ncbi:MAG: hypothetical protein H6574_11590 [Lewinellaceae bacterium]|nr:hypothetical protein [Lewinellaceae bacterium]